jgi:uncharacterized protein (TIGR02246 family)
MTEDERAIRDLVAAWMEATRRGDTAAVLDLMTDDVVFSVPGREPFGKEAFASASKAMEGMAFEGANEIVELKVLGDWAFVRNHIRISLTEPGKPPIRRSGYTLTLLQKEGPRWRLARDANMVTAE